MSRRITVPVRGLTVDVVYNERGQDVVWYLAGINWRLIANDRPLALTRREILVIDAYCVTDLRKRRMEWNRRKAARHQGAA